MEIRKAILKDSDQITVFFSKYLSRENDAIYSEEFFCPFGMRSAIKRGQMLIAVEGKNIIGALRFYRKKTRNQISLYQFAVDSNYRGNALILFMLEQLRDTDIVAFCPKKSTFNNYYQKMGWVLLDQTGQYNQWCLQKKSVLQ